MSAKSPSPPARANRRVALTLAAVVVAMGGLAYGAVPLYAMFCQVTGYGGTTRVASGAPADSASARMIRVSFDANVDPSLPWYFEPDQREVSVKLGEIAQVSYHVVNRSNRRITGMATYNVTPYAMGGYFNKTQCFCFDQQVLEPGQDMHMPVIFYVDPAMLEEPAARAISTVTLSYTFYEVPAAKVNAKQVARQGATPKPVP